MNETEQLLELLNSTFPDITAMSALDARNAVNSRVRPAANIDDALSSDHEIPTSYGTLRVRIYRQLAERERPLPVTIYAHGGGYLHGSIESHDSFCRLWSRGTGGTVISVDYRLAPEWGAPSAAEDLITALRWYQVEHPETKFLLAGDSSGANAAAVASTMLSGEGATPVVGQVLITPFLDPSMRGDTYVSRAKGYFITSAILATYWKHYLAAPRSNTAAPWQVNPSLAPDPDRLPPTVVITAGLDPLSSEGRSYAHTVATAGVPTLHRHYPDQFHGFFTIPGYGPATSATTVLWADIARLFLIEE